MNPQGRHAKDILTLEQRQLYASVFVKLDSNADGWMSRQECTDWLRGEGYALSDRQVEAIFRFMDVNMDGRITLDEFFTVMELVHAPPAKHTVAEDMFRNMDQDGDGYLTEDELMTGLKNCGYSLTADQVHKFAANLDTNKDGKISFEEFLVAFE